MNLTDRLSDMEQDTGASTSSTPAQQLAVYCIALIIFLIVFNNTMIILVVRKLEHINSISINSAQCLQMKALAVTDLTVGLFLLLAFVSAIFNRWIFENTMCKVMGMSLSSTLFMTFYILSFSSLDKYVLIFFPLRYSSFVTTFRTRILLVVLSVISVLLSTSLTSHVAYIPIVYVCLPPMSQSNNYLIQFILAVILWLLPCITVSSFGYINIFTLARKQRVQIEIQTSREIMSPISKGRRNLISLILTTLAWIICWIPFIFLFVTSPLHSQCTHLYTVAFIAQYMVFANSFMNWFIYYSTQPLFRQEQMKLFKWGLFN